MLSTANRAYNYCWLEVYEYEHMGISQQTGVCNVVLSSFPSLIRVVLSLVITNSAKYVIQKCVLPLWWHSYVHIT